MCGIAGFINYSKSPQKDTLLKMLNQIQYRGPDEQGFFIETNVALGIQRLSIIDLKSGDQPIFSEDKSVAVVFNGEIYNFLELRSDLKAKGHRFKTNSDTEVLVHLYEEYRDEMPKLLNGMFAFAIWDKKDQILFIARDQVGIKPLYYYFKNGLLIFGSEIKTILEHPEVKTDIDSEIVNLYSLFGYIPGNKTIYKDIHKLPPAHFLKFTRQNLYLKKYWEVNFKPNKNIQLENLLNDSVKLQSVADVPLGVFLSGGIDSSLVTYFLKMQNDKSIKTFSVSFEDKKFDESRYAFEVAKALGTTHYQEQFGVNDFREIFEKVSKNLDEPFADPSILPTFKVSALARQHVKVALSGDGGDELFGGYPTYQGHLVAQMLNLVPDFATKLISNFSQVLPVSFGSYSKKEVMDRFFTSTKLPLELRHLIWMSLDPSISLLDQNKKIITNIYQNENTNSFKSSLQAQLIDFKTYLTDDLLFKVDRASMYNSLEVRVPFLDTRIVNFAFSYQGSHLNLFQTKKLLRRLSNGKFSEEIVKRKKKGFGLPLDSWFKHELKDLVEDCLSNKKLFKYYDKKRVDKLWSDHQTNKNNNGKSLWMLMVLSRWLKN